MGKGAFYIQSTGTQSRPTWQGLRQNLIMATANAARGHPPRPTTPRIITREHADICLLAVAEKQKTSYLLVACNLL